jgi:hypothetical protein
MKEVGYLLRSFRVDTIGAKSTTEVLFNLKRK